MSADTIKLADARAPHRPVLVDDVVDALAPRAGSVILDCTLGAGGHAAALLELERGVRIVGVDRDHDARAMARRRLVRFGDRVRILEGTYADVVQGLVRVGETFDGVLADLGMSSMQVDDAVRGFSIRSQHPADMRMGDGCDEDALALIDRLDADDLADVLYSYGEERRSRRVARALKRAREDGVASAEGLASAVRAVLRGSHTRHPALRSFQALRIAVNDELGQLRRLLDCLPRLLRPGGRAAVISFHSLEDRMVKIAFRAGREAGHYEDVARKVITASPEERARNRRAAPAKLRWARRAQGE
jgi:16S rRNA (cytosine1402-N4)-methyltransferase